MCGTVLLVAAVAVGIDVGWQPLPGGGVEYIIQIEPQMLESFEPGLLAASDVPPHLGQIRSYRIIVGTDDLPREDPPELVESAEPTEAAPGEFTSGRPIDPFLGSGAPQPLTPEPGTKPLPEIPAVFSEDSVAETGPRSTQADLEESLDQGSSEPWLPLTITLAALFGAIGGMLYLGWIAWDYRSRYRALLERVIEAGAEHLSAIDVPGSPIG